MRIAIIGKFARLYDEEYIALAFEKLGHKVLRLPESTPTGPMLAEMDTFAPAIVLWAKLMVPEPARVVRHCQMKGYTSVCWVFDLYVGYAREYRLGHPAFKADHVFTTDGGHQKEFEARGINHHLLRQGINDAECYMLDGNPEGTIFIGSENPAYPMRQEQMRFMKKNYPGEFEWLGHHDTHEVRGEDLNIIFANTKVVVGDSVYSPYYWSNRIVETLGRGGFLIHQSVEGLAAEYPYLVTYQTGNLADLKKKVDYYLNHDDEREKLRKKNFEWVQARYTMTNRAKQMLQCLNTTNL